MGGGDRCAVGPCNNDRRYPQNYDIKSHVHTLKFHKLPSDEIMRKKWNSQILKGRQDYIPGNGIRVCSNHFSDGMPTSENPYPTLFLTLSDAISGTTPTKRREIKRHNNKKVIVDCETNCTLQSTSENDTADHAECSNESDFILCFQSTQITRDSDVNFFTGLSTTLVFQTLFNLLSSKAKCMQYWRGEKQTTCEMPSRYDQGLTFKRPGPRRKLSLELELLLVLMRLRLGLLVHDLAFRFNISDATVSSIFFTWTRLLRLELGKLIIWPTKHTIKSALPECFRRFYPNVRCIIDCTEVLLETPSSLEVQAKCWSDYKQHCTVKFLVAITPNGMFSYVSSVYGGRASDQFIVKDSHFYNLIEPYDQVMADRGFKIKEDLMMLMAKLAIPPSTTGKLQMQASDVSETSKIANVRIYVEQAIGRLKTYRFLKNEFPISCLPIVDDIAISCCALCNLLDPLVE